MPQSHLATSGSSALAESPTVSVCCVTFNHEAYIEQAVRSIFQQDTIFPIHVIVGDDCSSDRTQAILADLKQEFGERLTLLRRQKNLGMQQNFRESVGQCQGKYIALCEGDDYWTDPHKLQRQVEALEANPHWSGCFHQAQMVSEPGKIPLGFYPAEFSKPALEIDDLLEQNRAATASLVFRRSAIADLPPWFEQCPVCDWPLQILAVQHGPIGYLPQVMSVFRKHAQGMWTSKNSTDRNYQILRTFWVMEAGLQGEFRDKVANAAPVLFERAMAASIAPASPVLPHVQNMQESLSWRITAPFRWILDRIRNIVTNSARRTK